MTTYLNYSIQYYTSSTIIDKVIICSQVRNLKLDLRAISISLKSGNKHMLNWIMGCINVQRHNKLNWNILNYCI